MHASDIDVQNFQIVRKNMIRTDWYHIRDSVPDSQMSNIFVATMTTCWARLPVCWNCWVTEHCIMIQTRSSISTQTGPFLGELKSELNLDEFILQFCSGGRKNYTYVTNKSIQECKVKWFTLNFTNAQKINLQSMKEMLLSSDPLAKSITSTNPTKIPRDKNRKEKKKYKIAYTKRCVYWSTFQTYPYGYNVLYLFFPLKYNI